jgi:hypothetical protein
VDHPLHLAVAEELQRRLEGGAELVRDPACGGAQRLPLFVGPVKRRERRICDVDALIVAGGRVRVIVEIEESGFLPTKLCGKFLQAALATHFIHDSRKGAPLPYGDNALFVEVIDATKCLRPGSCKDVQGEMIEREIRSLLPMKKSRLGDYRLFFVHGPEDRAGLEAVGEAVEDALGVMA